MGIFSDLLLATLGVSAKQKYKLNGTNVIDMPINDISDPSGAASPDFISLSRGGFTYAIQAYDGGSTTEYKSYRAELAHGCDPNSGYEPHFRGTPTSDGVGTVRMVIEYALQKKEGNTIIGGTKTVTKTVVANGNTNGTEYYFSFPLKKSDTGLATMEEGDSILINIKRDPSQDTYSSDFAQIEFGIHGFVYGTGESGFYPLP